MKRIINTHEAPAAIGPYSQAVEANNILYISGQIPLNPKTGEIAGHSVAEQTEQVMINIGAILKEAGYKFSDVIKSTCYLADMDHFAEMNEVYSHYYNDNPPARAAVEVSRLPKDVLIEIETIAIKS